MTHLVPTVGTVPANKSPAGVAPWIRRRSFAWTVFLIPFLFLPYRWLWLPCGLAATWLLWPDRRSLRQRMKCDGNLIVGTLVVLLIRTGPDPLWWISWVGLMVVLMLIQHKRPLSRPWALGCVPLVWLLALITLGRTTIPARPLGTIGPGAVLVCAGDSLTSGVDIRSDAGTYVAALRERLGCHVVNAGFANDKARDLLKRLDKDVLARNPAAVLLFIGGNDYLDGTPRSILQQQLETIAEKIKASGAELIIVEVPTGIIWNSYAGVYRHLASRHGATLVPESQLRIWFSIELLVRDRLKDPLTIDGIHLSPAGARRVADWLEPYARAALAAK